MMSAGYLFQSTDTGAPTLTAENGKFIALLKACLIDGYGSIAPVGGWKILLNDAGTRAVFQGNRLTGGSGAVFSINDSGLYDSGMAAGVKMWESVNDFDAGINGTALRYIKKAFVSGTTAYPWKIIADDKFVFFIVNNQYLFCFGDLVKFHASDAYPAILFAATATTGASLFGRYGQSGDVLRALETQIGPATTGAMYANGTGHYYMGTYGLEAWPYFGQYVLARPYFSSSSNFTPRGFLPGFYVPFHNGTLFTNGNDYTVDSIVYKCVKWSSPSACCAFIDLANFRP